jgi:hypothetical protein
MNHEVDMVVLTDFLSSVALSNLETVVTERCSTNAQINRQYDEWVAFVNKVFKNKLPPHLHEVIEKSRTSATL